MYRQAHTGHDWQSGWSVLLVEAHFGINFLSILDFTWSQCVMKNVLLPFDLCAYTKYAHSGRYQSVTDVSSVYFTCLKMADSLVN